MRRTYVDGLKAPEVTLTYSTRDAAHCASARAMASSQLVPAPCSATTTPTAASAAPDHDSARSAASASSHDAGGTPRAYSSSFFWEGQIAGTGWTRLESPLSDVLERCTSKSKLKSRIQLVRRGDLRWQFTPQTLLLTPCDGHLGAQPFRVRRVERLVIPLEDDGASLETAASQRAVCATHCVQVSGSALHDLAADGALCAICQSALDTDSVVTLDVCEASAGRAPGHAFHYQCVCDSAVYEHRCPVCKARYGKPRGSAPRGGQMLVRRYAVGEEPLAGYEHEATWELVHSYENGIQGPEHPSPGTRFQGNEFFAYLPDSASDLVELFKRAFVARCLATIGTNHITGRQNTVVYAGIHHKNAPEGKFGYPDATYLERVRGELADAGFVL